MPPAIHRPVQPPPALRYCYQCFLPQSATVQLKVCAGCRVAEYCSKECQKAGWPRHKGECHHTCKLAEATDPNVLDAMLRAFGFKTRVDVLESLNEFLQAHRWALESHLHVSVRRKLGFEPGPGDIKDSILVVNLQCVAPPQSRKRLDPASRFRLRDDHFEFVPLDDFKNVSRERIEAFDRGYGDSRALTQELHGANALFLGAYPVAYRIWPLGILSFSSWQIYLPISRGLLLIFDADHRHKILEDLLLLATASVNAGVVLRGVDHPGQPVPGRVVRADKMWGFQPLFRAADWEASWDAYLAATPRPKGAALLDDAISRLQSGLSLLDLIHVAQMI